LNSNCEKRLEDKPSGLAATPPPVTVPFTMTPFEPDTWADPWLTKVAGLEFRVSDIVTAANAAFRAMLAAVNENVVDV
jgi:hypothetical protein